MLLMRWGYAVMHAANVKKNVRLYTRVPWCAMVYGINGWCHRIRLSM